MRKQERYNALVRERKSCRLCQGLTNPSGVEGGVWDSGQIGPWSQWQGNLNAALLLVGQDWGDTRYFLRYRGLEGPGNPTNNTLIKLLGSIGISIGQPSSGEGQNRAFFTNAILCLKEGGLQGTVQRDWFCNCAPYLRQQIDLVGPRVVVGLGRMAFNGVLQAYRLEPHSFRIAVRDPDGLRLPNGSLLFAVYHCGARILNTHRPFQDQLRDWQRIRAVLDEG